MSVRYRLVLAIGLLGMLGAAALAGRAQAPQAPTPSPGTPSNEKLDTRAVFDAVVRSRALVLDEMAARHRVVADADDPEVARLAEELARARERLARIVVRGPGDGAPERYRKLLDDARQEKEKAERALAGRSQTFREELARAQIGLEEVIAALPPDTALVAYVRYRHHDFSPPKPGSKPRDPVPHYLSFVLEHGQTEPTVIPLGPAEVIEALITKLSEQIAAEAAAAGRSARRNEAAYRQVGSELRRKVWDPISAQLGQAQRVFVVPDGALHLINLTALPIDKGGYLLETGPLVHYVSAERDLVPLQEGVPVGKGVLALGAPAFDDTRLFAALRPGEQPVGEKPPEQLVAMRAFRGARSACGEFQSLRFEPLPASAREAEEILALWQKAGGRTGIEEARLRSPSGGDVGGRHQLTGVGANEAAFKQQAPGKQVLHVATHGFFLGGRCRSALESAERGGVSAPPAAVTGENPLLLAGLALAGANHRQAAGPEEEDGILTAEEIASLNLNGTEWAVLSACDTGVGEVTAGEGVLGLRRAFQVAGVRTLIMSLWPVEDHAARQWMTTLYTQRFVEGRNTAESVRQASLQVLRQRRAKKQSTHPFYWAGFVAAGDWR